MARNKPRLQLAFYSRPKDSATYHYALFIAAKDDAAHEPIVKHHVKNVVEVDENGQTTSPWRYEQAIVENPENEPRLLIRLIVAKITVSSQELNEILKNVPVYQVNDADQVKAINFDDRTWVRDALQTLLNWGAITVRFEDWDFIERQALEYVDKKRKQGRWSSTWTGKPGVPLQDLFERREVVE